MSNRQQRRAAISESRHRKSWDWQELPIDDALLTRFPALRRIARALRNDFWIVQVFFFSSELGGMTHLAVRSVAETRPGSGSGLEPSWQDLQRIKNELCGEDAEAVQVYPRQSDVTDQANMYHLFVIPQKWPLPFGLHRENGFVRGPL
jgi:hypothetical protein